MKAYAKIEFTKQELEYIKSTVIAARLRVWDKWVEKKGQQGKDQDTLDALKYHESIIDFYGALINKLEKPFIDDTSQDGGSIFEDEERSGYR